MHATAPAEAATIGPPRRPSAWVVRFPDDLRDGAGSALSPGALVRVLAGRYSGSLGEVTGWGGRRGVDVVMIDRKGEDAVAPDQLEVVSTRVGPLQRSIDNVTVIAEPAVSTVLVHPVGGHDLALARRGQPGPFPDPATFTSKRPPNDQVKLDARRWGLACLGVLEGRPPEERERLVATWLAAPLLERVLNEGLLPLVVDRLCFVVTDQADGHVDDTFAFGELLALWVAGMREHRHRVITEVADPIVLRQEPHVFDSVLAAVRGEVGRVARRVRQVVVVVGPGTPAMSMGVTLGMVFGSDGKRVRPIYVARDQPLRIIDLPAVIRRSQVYQAAQEFLELRQPAPAARVLATTSGSGEADDLRAAVEVLASLVRRDLGAARAARGDLSALTGLGEWGAAAAARIERLLDLDSPADVSGLLTLANWDALAAAHPRTADPNRLVSQMAAINDNLPAQWFAHRGVDPTDGAALKGCFPGHDWEAFKRCHSTTSPSTRESLATGESGLPLGAANEIFACIASSPGKKKECLCNLWSHPIVTADPDLRAVAVRVVNDARGPLRELRNIGPLAHGVAAVTETVVQAAIGDERDVELRLRHRAAKVGLKPGSDAIGSACRAIAARLGELV